MHASPPLGIYAIRTLCQSTTYLTNRNWLACLYDHVVLHIFVDRFLPGHKYHVDNVGWSLVWILLCFHLHLFGTNSPNILKSQGFILRSFLCCSPPIPDNISGKYPNCYCIDLKFQKVHLLPPVHLKKA